MSSTDGAWSAETETEWVETAWGLVGVHQPMFPGDRPGELAPTTTATTRKAPPMNTQRTTSNAEPLTLALGEVAAVVAETGVDVASLTARRTLTAPEPVEVSVQIPDGADVARVAAAFEGLPAAPHLYPSDRPTSQAFAGSWAGNGREPLAATIRVNVYGPIALIVRVEVEHPDTMRDGVSGWPIYQGPPGDAFRELAPGTYVGVGTCDADGDETFDVRVFVTDTTSRAVRA